MQGVLKKYMEKPWGAMGCFCCFWCTIVGALILNVGIGYTTDAAEDNRSRLISDYDDAVGAWLSSGVQVYLAKYAGGLPFLGVNGLPSRHPNETFGQLELVTTGAQAFGTLPDGGGDYRRYSEGAFLKASLDNAHMPGVEDPSDLHVTVGDRIFTVRFFSQNIVDGRQCVSSKPNGDCLRYEPRYACDWEYLLSLMFVERPSGWIEHPSSPSCSFTHNSGRVWHDTRPQAVEQCQQQRTPQMEMPLEIAVRSANDPWVVAGSLTACTRTFGTTAGDNTRDAIIWCAVSSIFLVSAIYACYVCVRYTRTFVSENRESTYHNTVEPAPLGNPVTE